MDGRSLWNWIKKRPLLCMVGGFAIAGVAIGVIVLVTWVWIEPISAPEQEGTIKFRADHFNLWYQKEGKGISRREALIDQLQDDLAEVIDLLDVDPGLIPDPIDVFVHDDLPAMQSSIAKRKSTSSRGGYIAPLDLLVGESPRKSLAELVLAFGWGQCGSNLLRHGMSLYAAQPGRDFHAVLAALPPRLFHPLEELILMEDRGKFPESIYEQFDSPYSPAFIQFADLRSLVELSIETDVSPEAILELEAASFVKYLIELGGDIDTIKRIWGRGSTWNLLRRIEWVSLEDMGKHWYSHASQKGRNASDFEFLSVYYLLAAGFSDSAWAMCREWDASSLDQDELAIASLCALGVGRFDEAVAFSSRLEEGKDKTETFLSLYDGWKVSETQLIRVFISPEIPQMLWPKPSQLADYLSKIVERLALQPDDLPERVTIFFYPDEEKQSKGEGLFPLSTRYNASLHLTTSDDAQYEMASFIPAYCWRKETYSHLLHAGLTIALCNSGELLMEQGMALKEEGDWFPLASIDFGMAPDEVVEVEAGLMVDYIIETCGGGPLREIWISTSPLDEYLSLDKALSMVCSTTRRDIELVLFDRFVARKDKT